ncbi:MAG: DUF3343 domain-containing protein [Tissierellaceae bacterium]|nr:DUF3343 domain-containing protein [Tissierellaceae bacterium]
MNTEVYGVIVFKSTHYTIQAENILREKDIGFKTIPTPREISLSCGLAILVTMDDLEIIKDMMYKGEINVLNLYKYIRDGKKNQYEKII